MSVTKRIWLDCDPGHDDATAILLAIHAPNLRLTGVSTVHGNTDAVNTLSNAARCLYAFGAPENIKVYAGATLPLIRDARHDPEIHGTDGLGGVEGLPDASHPGVRERLEHSRGLRAVEGIAEAVRAGMKDHNETHGRSEDINEKLTIVSTGPMTNIALFVSVYADLLPGVEELVFMGGGVGVGNRSSVAEYNILCDPEAAQIVLNAPVRKTMVPLNVTHTAIVTRAVHNALLSPTFSPSDVPSQTTSVPKQAATPLRHTLSSLITFFAATYESTFGFVEGPPLHDALAVAYAARPALFTAVRHRVDVECAGTHTAGETVVDVWGYRQLNKKEDAWGRDGKNCVVTEKVDVPAFFEFFLDCVLRADQVSPLNQTK